MKSLDWLVIALYMVGMIVIGAYYARRTKTREEYLLGGRHMGPLMVGLSLFASILSTISYLAVPSEMIEHGPMAFSDVLAYPLVFLIVGWLVIPAFMKLRVTSAYEILEIRFGLSVRLLGASLFLILRFLWMSVIVYATTTQVIVPISGLPTWSAPLVSIAIGAITVVYTSMGGLRAVVLTDVIQASILFGGAILTLVLISSDLGGVSAWWPHEWMSHWDSFSLTVQTENRVTVPLAILAGLLWWICTAGSDQIAIQRYLATRDLTTARTTLAIALVAGAISVFLLGLVGLSLLAYFKHQTGLVTQSGQIDMQADQLFPKFIVTRLPAGVTGIVVAGLLAAAMSSLSSGISSVCSVFSSDFLDRLSPSTNGEGDTLRRTKRISWIIGIIVIGLSTIVGRIEGNLLEVSFKAANLLTAPLFLLVFMALFVPRANSLSAIAAAIASTVGAIGVAFFQWGGLSFIWILPVSLAAGIFTGLAMTWGRVLFAKSTDS